MIDARTRSSLGKKGGDGASHACFFLVASHAGLFSSGTLSLGLAYRFEHSAARTQISYHTEQETDRSPTDARGMNHGRADESDYPNLVREMSYEIPPQDLRINLARIPALPTSRLVMKKIKLLDD